MIIQENILKNNPFKTKLIKDVLIQKAIEICKKYNFYGKKIEGGDYFFKTPNHRINVRKRFDNLRLDVEIPEEGYCSVEYCQTTKSYKESQFWDNGIYRLPELKQELDKRLNIKNSNIDFEFIDFKVLCSNYINKDKNQFNKIFCDISFDEITHYVVQTIQKKYKLMDKINDFYYVSKDKKFVLEINSKDCYYCLNELLEPETKSIKRNLGRLNLNNTYYSSGQIFYNKGFLFFQDLYNAVIEAKFEILKREWR